MHDSQISHANLVDQINELWIWSKTAKIRNPIRMPAETNIRSPISKLGVEFNIRRPIAKFAIQFHNSHAMLIHQPMELYIWSTIPQFGQDFFTAGNFPANSGDQ